MSSVLDAFVRFLADKKDIDKALKTDIPNEAAASGTASGKRFGSTFSGAFKLTGKAVFGGLAVGAGLATKGLLELETVQAQFQADTGVTAEEADKAGKAINDMAGRNIQPLGEIGRALAKVHTDMGLTGDAAVKTTEKFLKFANVTHQDAAGAVTAFDDIMDNWGLTAEHSQEIMDKLIVSHQKYGGEIDKNQVSLAKLAPAFRAANFQIDDAIALLGLFGSKGLDADQATAAFAKALTKVKSPEELQRLIDDISNTTDPFLRASKAADLFGARAGAKLANALGGAHIKDFAIGMDEAAGATEKAAGVLENAFPEWLQLRIKGISSAIVGLGKDIGPLATGLVSLGSLASALGFTKLADKLATGLKAVWVRVAASSAVTGAVAAVSDKWATVLLKGMFAFDALEAGLKSGWARIANSGPVNAATGAAGKIMGTTLGKAASVAFAAVLVVEAIDTFQRVSQQIKDQLAALSEQNKVFMANATDQQIKDSIAGLRQQAGELAQSDLGEIIFGKSAAKALGSKTATDLANELEAELARRASSVSAATSGALAPAINDGLERVAKSIDPSDISKVVSSSIGNMGADWTKVARAQANRAGQAVADGIKAKRQSVDQAWQDLLDAIKNVEKPAVQRARLLGELTSKTLADALKDHRPEVRAQAEATKQAILDQLAELGTHTGNIGKAGMEALRKGMKSKDPDIRAASLAIYNAATSKISSIPDKAVGWGANVGYHFAAGMSGKKVIAAVEGAAKRLAGAAGAYLKISSPAEKGPLSTLGGPEGWGQRIGLFLTKGLAATIPGLMDTLDAALRTPVSMSLTTAGPSFTAAGPAVGRSANAAPVAGFADGGGHKTYNLTANVEGKPKARDPFAVAQQLRRFAEAGVWEPVDEE